MFFVVEMDDKGVNILVGIQMVVAVVVHNTPVAVVVDQMVVEAVAHQKMIMNMNQKIVVVVHWIQTLISQQNLKKISYVAIILHY